MDDDEGVRDVVRIVLETTGWTVELAPDGAAALERLRLQVPDVLLIDHRMPRMTGGELVKALGREGIRVPTVLMSGGDLASELAPRIGVGTWLQKPFGLDALERALAAAIAAHASERKAPAWSGE